MSTKDNEVNRTIDGEQAEGHAKRQFGEAEDAGKVSSKKHASLDDAETEGHKAFRMEDAETEGHRIKLPLEQDAGKTARKTRAVEDAETEGHKVFRI